jgi:hypothetical protein
VKALKRHAQAAVTLTPSAHARSYAVDDLAGASVAGLAMGFALVTLYLAQVFLFLCFFLRDTGVPACQGLQPV